MLRDIENCKIIALPPGSGALGALQFCDRLGEQNEGSSAPFLTARPLPTEEALAVEAPRQPVKAQPRPTHILYHDLAYPIAETPLTIGLAAVEGGSGIQIRNQVAGVSRKHCSIQLHGNKVVLNDHSTYGTYVNERPVTGTTNLEIGQVIRVGTPGEKLKLIACLDTAPDET